jgi:hypothetical protein
MMAETPAAMARNLSRLGYSVDKTRNGDYIISVGNITVTRFSGNPHPRWTASVLADLRNGPKPEQETKRPVLSNRDKFDQFVVNCRGEEPFTLRDVEGRADLKTEKRWNITTWLNTAVKRGMLHRVGTRSDPGLPPQITYGFGKAVEVKAAERRQTAFSIAMEEAKARKAARSQRKAGRGYLVGRVKAIADHPNRAEMLPIEFTAEQLFAVMEMPIPARVPLAHQMTRILNKGLLVKKGTVTLRSSGPGGWRRLYSFVDAPLSTQAFEETISEPVEVEAEVIETIEAVLPTEIPVTNTGSFKHHLAQAIRSMADALEAEDCPW